MSAPGAGAAAAAPHAARPGPACMTLLALPDDMLCEVFARLPVDVRLLCLRVCLAWAPALLSPSLWRVLDVSSTSGVAAFTVALVNEAAAMADGLRALDVRGRSACELPHAALLSLVCAHATTLRQVRVCRNRHLAAAQARGVGRFAPARRPTRLRAGAQQRNNFTPQPRLAHPSAPFLAGRPAGARRAGAARAGGVCRAGGARATARPPGRHGLHHRGAGHGHAAQPAAVAGASAGGPGRGRAVRRRARLRRARALALGTGSPALLGHALARPRRALSVSLLPACLPPSYLLSRKRFRPCPCPFSHATHTRDPLPPAQPRGAATRA